MYNLKINKREFFKLIGITTAAMTKLELQFFFCLITPDELETNGS